jgi:hypothetical protein|tara:strand:+ start:29 stop:208 length:180 start_codon:yes stop_codon:yes gene_type:complete
MKDKDIETAVNRMIIKEKKSSPKTSKSKEPTDAAGWLRKAYVDADPADGAPKVGNMGYV